MYMYIPYLCTDVNAIHLCCVYVCVFVCVCVCRFGQPLILRIWRDLTHHQFQSVVLKNMTQFLRDGLRLPEVRVHSITTATTYMYIRVYDIVFMFICWVN